MAITPQTTSYHRNRIGEGRQLFRIPSSRANPYLLTFDQAICHQSYDREQSQQNRCRPGNRQVTPLPLRFNSQVSARFFEGDFHPPTPHKPAQDLQRRVVRIGTSKGLRFIFTLWITRQDESESRLDRVPIYTKRRSRCRSPPCACHRHTNARPQVFSTASWAHPDVVAERDGAPL